MIRASHFPLLRAWLLTLALGCICLELNASPQEAGRPFLQNFPLREYHAHNQNWAAVQDAQGVMYFGNKAVVLEYDGVSWRKIRIGQTTYVRGLALDPASGRIYVGGVDELGFLEPGPDGEKIFVSLTAQLPPEAHGFRDIRRVYTTTEGILFVADEQVMRWRDGAFQVWKLPNASRLQSFVVAGQLLVHHRDFGLFRLEAGEFAPAALDPMFRSTELTMLIAEADGSFLLGTRENGLFKINGGVVSPVTSDVDAFLRDKKITRGLRLSDGSLALATASSGVVILDQEFRLRGRIDETSELQNNTVLDLFLDHEAGLWLCLNSGVTRVEAASAPSIFDAANGLGRTTVRDMLRFRGTLFAATGHGLFRLLPAAAAGARAAQFERAAEVETDFWSLCAHERGLLGAGGAGVFQLSEAGATQVLPSTVPFHVLHRSAVHPDRVFVGGRNGLRSIRFDAPSDRWMDEGAVAGVDHEVRTIVEDSHGELWLGTPTNGVYRVIFAASADAARANASVSRFLSTHGLPPGQQWTRVVRSVRSGVIFATQAGLYRFDRMAERFTPASEYGPRFADGSFMLGTVAEGTDQHLWLAGRTSDGVWVDQDLGRALTNANGEAGFQALPYKIADRIGEIEKFYPERDAAGGEIVWIGGTDGVVRVEVSRLAVAGEQDGFTTVIRRALAATRDGSTRPQSTSGSVLPYDQNTVRFEFATDAYAIGSGVRYQTRLQGFEDSHWSEFYEYTGVDYTNLPEGDYLFEVRAQDIDGRLGSVASFPFTIEPPWHRTAWAYVVYALLLAGAIVGIVRWQLRRSNSKNAQLESLVTERTRELRERETELVRAKEGADAANRAKSIFLANMSHELRTPLNAILGYTQILLKDDELSDKNRERLSVVGQSGTHLLTLINEVLDLAKIEAGKLTLNPASFAFDRLLADICLAFRQPVQEKGLEFSCTFAPGLPAVINSDAGKLRQVLFNLLSNALKFTERGRVAFKVTETAEGMIRFEVIDTGIGMRAEDLRDIFQAFHQATKTDPAVQGTGLGLTISQRLVELLGGKLNVESVLGRGSRFWFELLPVGATGNVALIEAGNRKRIAGFIGPRRRLLVTDDEPTNRTVLRDLLEPLGFAVEEANDGEQCLDTCQRNPPDAVLLDLRMGAVDGFEVARTLREKHGARFKIIAITASVFESDRQQALDAGCDDFLPKPFTEEQLLSTLGRVLSLEWRYALDELETAVAAAKGADPIAPPVEEIDAVLELSRRGDILGIKKRLASLAALEQGRYAPFVGILEPFVAAYQMNRIRDTMLKFKENGNSEP